MTMSAPDPSRQRRCSVPAFAAFAWSMLVSLACSDDPATQDGMETGPCIQGACFTGLVCLSDVCVEPNGGSGDDDGMPPGTGSDPTTSLTTADTTVAVDDTTVALDDTSCADECPDTGDASTAAPVDTGTTAAEETAGQCEPSGQGVYAECLDAGVGACVGPTGACVSAGVPAFGSICYFPCDDVCDCPPPPAGSAVGCDPILLDSDETVCHLDCSGGKTCPAGSICVSETSCIFADTTASYGDCVNDAGLCDEAGTCVVDDVMAPGAGVCSPPCQDAGDCSPPPSSGTPFCAELGNGAEVCLVACGDTANCPVGMICHGFFGICMWGLDGIPAYDPCLGGTELCELGASCWTIPAAAPTHSACGFDCQSSADCPPAPNGTAVPTCFDVGIEESCFLDCTNGQTCPAGTECVGDAGGTLVCMWPD